MLSPSAVIAAIEQNLFELPAFHAWPLAESHDGDDLLWTMTDFPYPLFNSVLRANLTPENADAAIDAAIARASSHNVPMLWWTTPSTRPVDLGERLIAHGFAHVGDRPGMALDLETWKPRDVEDVHLHIDLIRDAEMLRTWNAVPDGAEARYQLYLAAGGAFRHYLASIDGRPVATASLFPAAGVAGLYNIFTVPEMRRRGVAAALTMVALRDARAAGFDTAILHASQMSVDLYHDLGFEEHCSIGHYVWSA